MSSKMSSKMFLKLPRLLLATALITSSPLALSSQPGSPEPEGVKQVTHSSGARISGQLIKGDTLFDAPVSAVNLFSLNTESCGVLDFEVSQAGLTCTNCRANTAVLKNCTIPRDNAGWRL